MVGSSTAVPPPKLSHDNGRRDLLYSSLAHVALVTSVHYGLLICPALSIDLNIIKGNFNSTLPHGYLHIRG